LWNATDGFPSQKNRKKLDQDFEKLKHETPEERTARQGKEQENSILRDMLDGSTSVFSVKRYLAVGQLMCFRPRRTPDIIARQYGKMFSKVEGKLWIDKSDFG